MLLKKNLKCYKGGAEYVKESLNFSLKWDRHLGEMTVRFIVSEHSRLQATSASLLHPLVTADQ